MCRACSAIWSTPSDQTAKPAPRKPQTFVPALVGTIEATPIERHVRSILPIRAAKVPSRAEPIRRDVVDCEVLVSICYSRFRDETVGFGDSLVGEGLVPGELEDEP